MPNAPKTQHRSVRVDDELWSSADQATKADGTDRSSVINAFLRWYVREPGAKLPKRPE
jgi:antitoxin component of RelBE/YafQ-DinJ toxin-antitoxin module